MRFYLWLILATMVWSQSNWILPSDPHIQYVGRWDLRDPQAAVADWPGVYLRVAFAGSGCQVRLQGVGVFTPVLDGEVKPVLVVGDSVQSFEIAKDLSSEKHTLVLYKRSENQTNTVRFLGLQLSSGAQLAEASARPVRRIEFIGDSYTVGYGMESPVREPGALNEDSLVLFTTNSYAAFGPALARSFGAEYQLNAISGRGLVRNLNGILPDKSFATYYDYTLHSARNTNHESPRWDFASWHPQVIVIGLGINDFQANPPYADTVAFDKAYQALLDSLRNRHPGVKFILCATSVWPTEMLIPRVKAIVAAQAKHQDTQYFEYGAEKTGLWWHPDVNDHQNITRALRPMVAKAGGWLSR